MIVMVVSVTCHWNNAAVSGDGAADVFELYGRVVDLEALPQKIVEPLQDGVAE